MTNNLTFSVLLLVLLATSIFFGYKYFKSPAYVSGPQCAQSAINLSKDMRKLWEDHIVWTRNYIISALSDLKDLEPVAQRLLQNQVDIGDALKPIYGQEAGSTLTGLLKDHILIATEVVKAAKEGNSEAVDASSKKWHSNADDIAKFLSEANPNWPFEIVKDMLYKHLEYTTGEVVSRLKKDWASDISFYDKNHVHMLMLSDAITDGIVKQFPDKFR